MKLYLTILAALFTKDLFILIKEKVQSGTYKFHWKFQTLAQAHYAKGVDSFLYSNANRWTQDTYYCFLEERFPKHVKWRYLFKVTREVPCPYKNQTP